MWLSISSETLSPFTVENNFFFSLYRTLTETSKRRGVFIDWLWPVASVCYLFYQSVVDTHRKREQTEIATTHLLVLYVAAKAFPSKFQLRFWSSARGNRPYKPHGAGKLNRSIKSRSFKNFIHKIHSFNSQKLRLQPRMMMVWPGRTEQTMGCIPYIFHYIAMCLCSYMYIGRFEHVFYHAIKLENPYDVDMPKSTTNFVNVFRFSSLISKWKWHSFFSHLF